MKLQPLSRAALLALGAFASAPSAAAQTVAVRAGTIHKVDKGELIEGGGTILIEDGRVVAVGKDLAIPASARIVDFGPDAVITPGLVSADSSYGGTRGSERTADPTLRAVDAFDLYGSYVLALSQGVTSVYLAPARGRLIAGQGAVVKLAGSDERRRVLDESAMIHGAISAEARNTPGYWKPPIPATAEVGMGVEEPQLPRSLAGAVVALRELMALARDPSLDAQTYGPDTGPALRDLVVARKPWRMTATNAPEVRALLAFARESGVPLIIEGGQGTGELARELAEAGIAVIVEAPIQPNTLGRDHGKEPDAEWPRFDVAAGLSKAGVRFAIAPPDQVPASELRFAAAVASRGGLERAAALRAITLSAAEILGVADRVGSLVPGKDADFVVFNGDPLGLSSVVETWVFGESVYKANEKAAVVLSVEELHLGDGRVLSPGEVLLKDGRIQSVGRRVGRPFGAQVVRGHAAMPGMIDAFGHLGLEGSTRVPATRFELKRIVEPGDRTDARVAQAGVTTVVMAPRAPSRSGAPVMAYKPAGSDLDRMVIEDPTALRLQWTDKNRLESGKAVREVLAKATEYKRKWDDYAKKRAAWTPPKEPEAKAAGAAAEGADKKEGEADKRADAEKKPEAEKKADAEKKPDADSKDEKKPEEADKKKKKKGEEEPAKPVTGAWETRITVPPHAETRFRLYLDEVDGAVEGSLRCDALSDDLVQVSGRRVERKLSLSGQGTRGTITIEAEQVEGKLEGQVTLGDGKTDFEATQTSIEYRTAGRSERRKPKEEKKEIKGEPKPPPVDPDLEPFRRAIEGSGAIVVGVEREDEILACVDAFAAAGIKPVLLGADHAHKVADRIRGRVSGVLLSERIVHSEPKTGVERRNRYAELVAAGIPIAFHSGAEEGAADLPLMATYAVAQGLGPDDALRALTSGAADMFAISDRVGRIATGLDADVLLLDGSPLEASTSVVRAWVDGREVR